jgi:hypothetical protein
MNRGLASQDLYGMGSCGWLRVVKWVFVPKTAGLGASTGWLATSRLDRLTASLERHPVGYTKCLNSEVDGG